MHPSPVPTTVAQPRPLVTLVVPAYNEAAVLRENMEEILAYLTQLETRYRWQVLLVNDGSSDDTGRIAEELARVDPRVAVIHHPHNRGLGAAFKTGFEASRGDYVVTLDVDLSYSPDHIEAMLEELRSTNAQLVLASPYMKGGRLTNVPWPRRTLSIWGNRFLRVFARGQVSTLTCMVRAYDGPFIRSLVLRSSGMDIMPEVVYKAMIMRARIVQVPGHLDWSKQLAAGPRRTSSMRIMRHVFSTVLSGFIFRPFMFLVLPGLALLAFSASVNLWMFIHFFNALAALPPEQRTASDAVAQAFADHPHTFVIGLLSLMLAILLVGLGVIALQAKRYFEELYYLGVSLRGSGRPRE